MPIVIDSDAHSTRTLDVIRYGVATARRAWLTKKHVANTRTWPQLDKLRKRGRRKAARPAPLTLRQAPQARGARQLDRAERRRSAPRSSARRRAPRSRSPPRSCLRHASATRNAPPATTAENCGKSHDRPAASTAETASSHSRLSSTDARPDLGQRGRGARIGQQPADRRASSRRDGRARPRSAAATTHHATAKMIVVVSSCDAATSDRHDRERGPLGGQRAARSI